MDYRPHSILQILIFHYTSCIRCDKEKAGLNSNKDMLIDGMGIAGFISLTCSPASPFKVSREQVEN